MHRSSWPRPREGLFSRQRSSCLEPLPAPPPPTQNVQLGIGSLRSLPDPLGAVPDVDAQLQLLTLGGS